MTPAKQLLVFWIILMLLVTFTCLLVFRVAQQSLRLGAFALPVQLVKETAIKLQNGEPVKSVISTEKIDISRSLSPFLMVFDKNKNLLATSGMIGNSKPSLPKGVLDYVDKHGEDRVTWQPKKDLLFATVATKYDNGYIVAARSLQETGNLIFRIGQLVLAAWAAFFGCSLLAYGMVLRVYKEQAGKP